MLNFLVLLYKFFVYILLFKIIFSCRKSCKEQGLVSNEGAALKQFTALLTTFDYHFVIKLIKSAYIFIQILKLKKIKASVSILFDHTFFVCIYIYIIFQLRTWSSRWSAVAEILDCHIISEFECQLCYYVHFQMNTLEKCRNPFILPAMYSIVLLLSFYKDGFGIR